MKICIGCDYHSKAAVQIPNGPMAMADVCNFSECCNPVSGEPMICNAVRSNPDFCGIKGRFWKAKEVKESAKVIKLV